ncbi:MAG: type II toxin-antitoxin system VapC family toxin [Terriglobales bacterium]
MGLVEWRARLLRHRLLALDTNVLIYHLESDRRFGALANAALELIASGKTAGVTSSITMTELLIPAYRAGDEPRVDAIFAAATMLPGLRWLAPDLDIADRAARLRAQWRLRTPDALQAATAEAAGATAIVTNDSAFARLPGLEALILGRWLR